MRRVTFCALVVLCLGIHPTAQTYKGRTERGAFEAADALVRGSINGSPKGAPAVPLDLDVSVAVWSPMALGPVPFLRLTHTVGGDLTGDLYAWWMAPVGSQLPNRICTPRDEGVQVCVAKVGVAKPVDWKSLLVDVVAARVCSMQLTSGPIAVTTDAGDLVVRLSSEGKTETYLCNAPRYDGRAGAAEAARVMDVLGTLTAASVSLAADNVTLVLRQDYGRALYRDCRLDINVVNGIGSAALLCNYNRQTPATLHADRALTPREAADFSTLVSESDLCSGGNIGRDERAGDGVLETLMTTCQGSRVAVLVTSGNPTFTSNDARRRLLERIHALEADLHKAGQPPK